MENNLILIKKIMISLISSVRSVSYFKTVSNHIGNTTSNKSNLSIFRTITLNSKVSINSDRLALEELKKTQAIAKYIRGSPSKYRRILDSIRGRTFNEAMMILEYLPHRACEPILKCLISAANNANINFDIKKSNICIQKAHCDMGPVRRRYQPRAKGKGYKIRKPTSHIHIIITEI